MFIELEIVFTLLTVFFKFEVELFRASDIFSLMCVHHLPHCELKSFMSSLFSYNTIQSHC